MFDQLSERLQATLSDVRSRGKLNEGDVDAAMRDIRLALLEADVNFKVVKSFTATLKERCLGAEVLDSLDPGQQVIKIVNEELTALMGGTGRELAFASNGPTVILMAGLQGSGKTTACAKLAAQLDRTGKNVALAACDVYRPAAVDQLVTIAKEASAHVYEQGTDADPVEIAGWALDRAREENRDVLIVDTAGRLHVDEDLMAELARIRKRVKPHNVLLVVDAMTGQEAVGVAEAFAETAEFDGVVMTKLDGDARGGAALSVRTVTGKPIMYASTGEKLRDFDQFHPDRMASRILGMGDVLSLIEKAEREVDENQAIDLQKKLQREQFTLEDFLKQMQQVRKMGPISGLVGMLPGMGGMKQQLKGADVDEGELDRTEAIILSMTPEERANPGMINGSRRKRIATGSGTKVQHVNQLVKQFDQIRKLMRQVVSGKPLDPQQLAQMSQAGGRAQRPKVRRR
ncbi:MAG: signal recognition particle protein [Solirubrobacterales bacterium]